MTSVAAETTTAGLARGGRETNIRTETGSTVRGTPQLSRIWLIRLAVLPRPWVRSWTECGRLKVRDKLRDKDKVQVEAKANRRRATRKGSPGM